MDLGETRLNESTVLAHLDNGLAPAPVAPESNYPDIPQHTPKVHAANAGRKGRRAVAQASSSTIPATSLPLLEQYNEQRLAELANHTTGNIRDQSSLYRVLESEASELLAKRAYPAGNDREEDALHKRRRRRESSSSWKSTESFPHADDKHEDSSNGTLDQSPKQISPHVRRDEESIHERERERNNQARINRARNNGLLGSHREMAPTETTTNVYSSARAMRLQDQQHENAQHESHIKDEPREDNEFPVDDYSVFPTHMDENGTPPRRKSPSPPWIRGANYDEPSRAPRGEVAFHLGQRRGNAFLPGPRLGDASYPGPRIDNTLPLGPRADKSVNLYSLCKGNNTRKLGNKEIAQISAAQTRYDLVFKGEGCAFDLSAELSSSFSHLSDGEKGKLNEAQRLLDDAVRGTGRERTIVKVENVVEASGSGSAIKASPAKVMGASASGSGAVRGKGKGKAAVPNAQPATAPPPPQEPQAQVLQVQTPQPVVSQLPMPTRTVLALPRMNITPQTAQLAYDIVLEVNNLLSEEGGAFHVEFGAQDNREIKKLR
jgi:hypothetical protein